MTNRKIVDYITIIKGYQEEFDKEVNSKLRLGYSLHLGIIHLIGCSKTALCQSMVKYEEPILKNMRKLIDLMEEKLSPEEIEEVEREALQEYEIMKND